MKNWFQSLLFKWVQLVPLHIGEILHSIRTNRLNSIGINRQDKSAMEYGAMRRGGCTSSIQLTPSA
jgi:hypothetical protein